MLKNGSHGKRRITSGIVQLGLDNESISSPHLQRGLIPTLGAIYETTIEKAKEDVLIINNGNLEEVRIFKSWWQV